MTSDCLPARECVNFDPTACSGPVTLHWTATNGAWPRCQVHAEQREQLERRLTQRYPTRPPADWSPLDAGEHWEVEW